MYIPSYSELTEIFLAEVGAKSQPLNISESDVLSFKLEQDEKTIPNKATSIAGSLNTLFILLSPCCPVGSPHNNWLYRRQLDCLSATNLCYAYFYCWYD